jgi:hypothetical protein
VGEESITGLGRIADLLGVSRTRILQRVKAGTLRATRDRDGQYVCTLADIDALSKVTKGRPVSRRRIDADQLTPETVQKAFELFEAGAGMAQLVAETHLLPDRLRELYAEWRTPLGQAVRVPKIVRVKVEDEEKQGAAVVELALKMAQLKSDTLMEKKKSKRGKVRRP